MKHRSIFLLIFCLIFVSRFNVCQAYSLQELITDYMGISWFLPKDQSSTIPLADTVPASDVNTQDEIDPPPSTITFPSNESSGDSARREFLEIFKGEQYTSFLIASQRSAQQFSRRLYTPVRNLSLNEECDPLMNNEVKAWADVSGGYSSQSKEHHFKGYQMNDFNVNLGIQRSLNDWMKDCSWLKFIPPRCLSGWTVGAALSYEYEHFDFTRGSKANMNNTQGAIYALCTGPWYYAFSTLVIGYNTGSLERSMRFESLRATAHSKPKIFQVSGSYEFGLNKYSYCDTYIQPFVGIDSGYYHFSKIKENGDDVANLEIHQKGVTLTNSRVGVHLTRDQDLDGTWTFALDLTWNHLFDFHNKLKGRFLLSDDIFKIEGFKPGCNGLECAFTAFKEFSDCLEAYAEVSGEVWENYYNVYLRAGASWRW